MKTIWILAFWLLSTIANAQHTFSIVAVDSVTGEIGSAGATCLPDELGALDISKIILGVGAIHTQAYWTSVNQQAASERMELGDSPEEIIQWLTENDTPTEGGGVQDRQYGIVDLNNGSPRSAAFTGDNNYSEKGHRIGSGYAIQGNILISEEVLDDMEAAFLNTEGPLCDKLMQVMQAAKRPGADVRCLDQGISSGSAFIRVAKPSDTNSEYGNLWLDINVWLNSGSFTGDPIDELQLQFDAFKTANGYVPVDSPSLDIYPNPTEGLIQVKTTIECLAIKVYDPIGKLVYSSPIDPNASNYSIDLSSLPVNNYWITFEVEKGILTRELFKSVCKY